MAAGGAVIGAALFIFRAAGAGIVIRIASFQMAADTLLTMLRNRLVGIGRQGKKHHDHQLDHRDQPDIDQPVNYVSVLY